MKEFQIIVTGNNYHSIKQFINCIGDGKIQSTNITCLDRVTTQVTDTIIEYNYCQVDDKHKIKFLVGKAVWHSEYFESIESDEFKALVMLVDAKHESNIEKIEHDIKKHTEYLSDFAMIVVLANLIVDNKTIRNQVNQMIKSNNWLLPVLEINPTNKIEVSLVIESLLYFKNPMPKKNNSVQTSSQY